MTGEAWGAITIINATATGIGCSMAIDARTKAEWTWTGHDLAWQSDVDDRLARAVLAHAREGLGRDGAQASCTTPFPPARGLKTSSAAATAMLRAAWEAAGREGPPGLDHLAVRCAVDAGVTLTGAYDDQVAVSRGGCHLTDNRHGAVLESFDGGDWHVAVWIPDARVDKQQLKAIDASVLRPRIEAAIQQLRDGDLPAALEENGRAYHSLYAAAGLPVTEAPVQTAMAAGAEAAGLSGTGPAVAALFEAPVDVPDVAGGRWTWHRSVAA